MADERGPGRPSRRALLARVDATRAELDAFGGLPAPDLTGGLWRDIWRDDVHHSTAIEGNTLTAAQVRLLLEEDKAAGRADLAEYLEVRGYADAADWVYAHAISPASGWQATDALTITEIREIHRRVTELPWRVRPPRPLDEGEGPGTYRRHDIRRFDSGMRPPAWTEVAALMSGWVRRASTAAPAGWHPIEHLASLHADLERIHPFRDGNGRTGRLVLNLQLVRRGYPPAVIQRRQRDRYLRALARADRDDIGLLTELIARAVEDSLERFLLPAVAADQDLVPIRALAGQRLSEGAMTQAIRRGRMRGVRRDGRWCSTRRWLEDYLAARGQRG